MITRILNSKHLPYAFLFLPILIFFAPVLFQNKLALPADTIPALHHPLLDATRSTYPNGPPYKNFLITDSIRQQYPWRQFSIDQLKAGRLPWWNPYNFSGTPHLANFQSATFYPLNFVYWLVDFPTGWNIQVFLQSFLGCIFTYLFLRNLKLHPLAATFGAIVWIFSGFFIAWLEWNTTVQVVVWTPLILLFIDSIIIHKQFQLWPLLSFSLTAQLFAGYPQPWLYMSLLQLAYLTLRLRYHLSKSTLIPLLSAYFFFALLGSVQLVPTLQYSSLTNRDLDQGGIDYHLTRPDWFIPYQNLIQVIVPDFFGNPATLNYWGVFNYTEFVSYIGIIPLLFVLLSSTNNKSRTYYFFLGALVIALIFATKNPLSLLQLKADIPFISSSQPSRWLTVVDFALAVLAAHGLDHFLRKRTNPLLPIFIISCIIAFGWLFALKPNLFISNPDPTNLQVTQRNLILPTAELAVVSLLFIFAFKFAKNQTSRRGIVIAFIIITTLSGLRFAKKFTPFSDRAFLYPESSILTYLQQNAGLDRYATTDRRIMAPNINLPYHLYSLEGYDPMYLYDYARLISAVDFDSIPDQPRGFNRTVLTNKIDSPIVDLLGVKYLLSLTPLDGDQYQQIMNEGETFLYQNLEAFPRAFVTAQQDPFSLTADSVTPAAITEYTPGKVVIEASSQTQSTLILTDAWYPDWTATIDGQSVTVANWNGLRATIIPEGTHLVVYEYKYRYPQL